MNRNPVPAAPLTASSPIATASPPKKLSRARISWVWLSLASIYGHLFVSAYGDNPEGPTGRLWATTLAHLSSEQLSRGLETCARSCDDYAPSLPLFHARCLGIPTLAAVTDDLHRRPGSPMGFTRMVWDLVDAYAFARADQRTAERMLRNAYDLARERAINGAPVPEDGALASITQDHDAEQELYDRLHMARMRELCTCGADCGKLSRTSPETH